MFDLIGLLVNGLSCSVDRLTGEAELDLPADIIELSEALLNIQFWPMD